MISVSRPYAHLAFLVLITVFLALVSSGASSIGFEEVTLPSGIQYTGQSYGASWGDVNRDGWPDLWVGNHGAPPNLFQNNGDGTFSEISSQVNYDLADMHGAAWGDFDNDGDQDLFMLVGAVSGTASGPNQLLLNSDGLVQETAQAYGLDYPLGRGRTPLWFDWDGDGKLDIFVANKPRSDGAAPSALFSQTEGGFVDSFGQTGLATPTTNNYAQLIALGNQKTPALIVSGNTFPDRVYDYGITPFVDLNGAMGLFPNNLWGTRDSAIADFDGDLLPDIFLLRANNGSEVAQTGANTVAASIDLVADEKGFSFFGGNNLQVKIEPPWRIKPEEIFIGSQGINPSDSVFSLSMGDVSVNGMPPHVPGTDVGVFIGYDVVLGEWQFLVSNNAWTSLNFVVASDNSITGLKAVGFANSDGDVVDKLYSQNGTGFDDVSTASGVTLASHCGAVTAADFDNDMDVDLYLVCDGPVINRPNILYENLGNGAFQSILDAGGAVGSADGRGETVAAADFNGDGFVDLFVTNGLGSEPFNSGPSQLFRNLGNGNHWLEIDLEGVVSNRDGVGARTLATSGGVTQLREQGGGMHLHAQNHQRIHFGLGNNTKVEQLSVEWPSGIVQEINNLPADEIVHVIESSSPSVFGRPTYAPGVESGVYIWKETFDGPYRLRVNGNGALSEFNVQLIADQALQGVLPFQLNTYDTMNWFGNHFFLASRVTAGEDGIDINLPSSAEALIAVEQDGVPNPRQLHIGASGKPLSPAGWIVDIDKLPKLPQFQGGTDLGLFVGKNGITDPVVARWNGDGQFHRADLTMLFSEPIVSVAQVGFEVNDVLVNTALSVRSSGEVISWWDGLNVSVQQGSKLGFAYVQDGLSQPNRVNPNTRDFGLTNAYWLPRAEPYGAPQYNPVGDAGLFLWKDQAADVWHLRVTAGGGHARYVGELVSDLPFTSVNPFKVEAGDVLDTTNATRIMFDLEMWSPWEDGIDFRVPAGAAIYLDFQEVSGAGGRSPEFIRIGAQGWPVGNVPLDISGW